MSDVIERIARAICGVNVGGSGGPDSRYGDNEERIDSNWRDYVDEARAAYAETIAALAEGVTDEMVFASLSDFGGGGAARMVIYHEEREFQRRAIAAAIRAAGKE